jgi:hypothetical protein
LATGNIGRDSTIVLRMHTKVDPENSGELVWPLYFSFFRHFDTFFKDELEKDIARSFVAFVDSPLKHFFSFTEIGPLVQDLAFCATELFDSFHY